MPIRFSKQEIQGIIRQVEAEGGDATQWKEMLGADEPAAVHGDQLPDDEAWAKAKWDETPSIETGADLVCSMCHKPATELRAQACYDCFRTWAISCKPKPKKRRL